MRRRCPWSRESAEVAREVVALTRLAPHVGPVVPEILAAIAQRGDRDAQMAEPIDDVGPLPKIGDGQVRAAGLPIATGVIDGACRCLVQDRLGRTGARWSLDGAEAVLRLRALRASGDFDA